MVQAMIEIPKEANQILNIVKARYNLKTKSEAIAKIVIECGANIIEPELRPEYLEKLMKIEEEGYGETFDSIEQLRKKIEKKIIGGNIDATNLKKIAINKIIYNYQQITVGNFMIVASQNTSTDTFNLVIHEKVFKTISGLPCNIQNKVKISKDDRFNGKSWAKEFNSVWGAKNISPADYVDIVKWLQAITKLTCFL